MNDPYIREVILRGNELELLERAADALPETHPVLRGIVAAAAAVLALLLPSVSAAQVFF